MAGTLQAVNIFGGGEVEPTIPLILVNTVCTCGVKKTARVVGGQDASVGFKTVQSRGRFLKTIPFGIPTYAGVKTGF